MVRKIVKSEEEVKDDQGIYYTPKKSLVTFTSGCSLLDCALGGGWPVGRVSNIVGDKSTGKTLLAIEACANFARRFPDGLIRYGEAEAAFDKSYAESVGFPVDRVEFVGEADGESELITIEDLFEDLTATIDKMREQNIYPGLYVVDSLDALSDRDEQVRDMDKGSYGAEKAKKLSQLFRRLIRPMEEVGLTLMVISQVRDAIGVTFGKKYRRSGGRALDFYASQVIYLAQIQKVYMTHRSVKRPIGILVKAKLEKNKIGMPYREVDFQIVFGYGIDDIQAGLAYLKTTGLLKDLYEECEPTKKAKQIMALPDAEFKVERKRINKAVKLAWKSVEKGFEPKRRKY